MDNIRRLQYLLMFVPRLTPSEIFLGSPNLDKGDEHSVRGNQRNNRLIGRYFATAEAQGGNANSDTQTTNNDIVSAVQLYYEASNNPDSLEFLREAWGKNPDKAIWLQHTTSETLQDILIKLGIETAEPAAPAVELAAPAVEPAASVIEADVPKPQSPEIQVIRKLMQNPNDESRLTEFIKLWQANPNFTHWQEAVKDQTSTTGFPKGAYLIEFMANTLSRAQVYPNPLITEKATVPTYNQSDILAGFLRGEFAGKALTEDEAREILTGSIENNTLIKLAVFDYLQHDGAKLDTKTLLYFTSFMLTFATNQHKNRFTPGFITLLSTRLSEIENPETYEPSDEFHKSKYLLTQVSLTQIKPQYPQTTPN